MSEAPAVKAPRPRNAEASRHALLRAASELFSDKGFDQTTTRSIGERAGVDPALIARYYGNKLNLYLATLTEDGHGPGPLVGSPDIATYVDRLLDRLERQGPGPLMQVLVRTDTADEVRTAARPHLDQRLVGPLTRLLSERNVSQPQLKAETAVAALTGIFVARTTKSLEGLSRISRAELATLSAAVIEGIAGS